MKHLFWLGFFWTTLFLAQAFFGPLLLALFPKPGKGPKEADQKQREYFMTAAFGPFLALTSFGHSLIVQNRPKEADQKKPDQASFGLFHKF